MLNRSYYDDNFAYELMELYTALDTSIIEAMARRIAKTGYVTDYTRWQAEVLQDAGLLYEDILRLIAEHTGMSDAYLRRVFEDAGVESISFDNSIYEAAGLEPVPLRQSPSMMNLLRAGLKKTGGSLRNLTMTTANTTQTAYINACNLAYMQTSSGAMSYTEAIRAAVKSSVSQGSKVLYPSGHQDQLDVAIRRSVLTGVSQTCAVVAMESAKENGCDLMEITAHAGARPEHAAWQGKIVSLSGRKGYLSLADIGYGSVTGFKGANCRHDWYPFFEGISTRLYSDKQLEELGRSDLYDLQQGQRAMERQIRAAKRELAGYDAAMSAADEDTAKAIKQDFDAAAVKLKKQEAALKDYCRQNGLLVDNSRTQALYGDGTTQGFGRSAAQKAVWANKKALQNSGISDTMKSKPDAIAVTQEAIDNLPHVDVPVGSDSLSMIIHAEHKQLLRRAMDEPLGTEVGAICRLDGEHIWDGSGMGSIRIPDKPFDYVAMHTHPSGLVFSANDIQRFINRQHLRGLTAVGNDGTVYAMWKTDSYNSNKLRIAFVDLSCELSALVKAGDIDGYVKAIYGFLNGGSQYGIFFDERRI